MDSMKNLIDLLVKNKGCYAVDWNLIYKVLS